MRRTIVILLVAIMLAGGLCPAFAANSLLPTPKPGNAATGSVSLPNYGSFSGNEGSLTAQDYAYNGRTWIVYYYPMTNNWGNEVDEWISACNSRGFKRTMDKFDGKTGYRMEKNGLQAILVPGLNGQVLLMVEAGLPMDDFEVVEEKPLETNQYRVEYNGIKATGNWFGGGKLNEYGHYYGFYNVVQDPNIEYLAVRIPSNVKTGTHSYYTRDSKIKDTAYFLSVKSGGNFLFDGAPFAPSHQMKSKKDYFECTIYYRDRYEIQGVIKGSFNDGKDVITVEFNISI